jgi:hypothetical protein
LNAQSCQNGRVPFTPFHFGVGVGIHAVAPRKISLISFCATNVLMDVETLYYLSRSQFPLHRFFHTFVGVTLVIVVTVVLAAALLRLARRVQLPNPFDWQELTLRAVIVGAVLGGYSHVVLDSVMHGEIRPFFPFSDHNPFYAGISLAALHWTCVIAGAAGLLVLAVREWWSERQET